MSSSVPKGWKGGREGGAQRRTSTCTTTTHICVQQAKKMMIIGEAKTGFLSTVLKFPDYAIIHESKTEHDVHSYDSGQD